ncbi:tetratricopeptide repeat protein [Tepidamorphus sp. 3E244]|uniref:DUF2659 family protein n=1 Tax=Tepidamorphus sp. 3E244 TaxID=3385498 RepID=UPI0038FBE6EF
MTDFFREVDEELRRERMNDVWKRFGPIIMGVAVLIVLATAGYRFWEWYQARTAGAAGEAYVSAVRDNDDNPQQMEAALEELAEGGTGFEDLARMRIAAARGQAGDVDGAVAAYDDIAADSGVDDRVRELARIRAANLLIDTASLADMNARIGGLTGEDAPMRHSAREILGLTAYRNGDYAEAAEQFDAIIADSGAPQDMRSRVELMQSLLAARLAAAGEGSGQ